MIVSQVWTCACADENLTCTAECIFWSGYLGLLTDIHTQASGPSAATTCLITNIRTLWNILWSLHQMGIFNSFLSIGKGTWPTVSLYRNLIFWISLILMMLYWQIVDLQFWDDLLFRQATLVTLSASYGKSQMTTENVIKTRKIANARIHVERATNRLKWFRILSSVVPLTLMPVFDDVLLTCAAMQRQRRRSRCHHYDV